MGEIVIRSRDGMSNVGPRSAKHALCIHQNKRRRTEEEKSHKFKQIHDYRLKLNNEIGGFSWPYTESSRTKLLL